jgi:hypothetical protein
MTTIAAAVRDFKHPIDDRCGFGETDEALSGKNAAKSPQIGMTGCGAAVYYPVHV